MILVVFQLFMGQSKTGVFDQSSTRISIQSCLGLSRWALSKIELIQGNLATLVVNVIEGLHLFAGYMKPMQGARCADSVFIYTQNTCLL